MKYLDFSNLYFQIAIAISIIVLAATSILSVRGKSVRPLRITNTICFVLTIIFALIAAFSYSTYFLAIGIVLIIVVYLIFSSINLLPDFHPYSPVVIVEDRDNSVGCSTFSGLVVVFGILMYLIFSKYADTKIAQKEDFKLFDISIFLLFFCTTLCMASWLISRLASKIISHGNQSRIFEVNRNINGEKITSLIIEGDINQALYELKNISEVRNKGNIQKACILLMSNLREIENRYNINHLSLEDFRIEKTKISEKIINLTKEL